MNKNILFTVLLTFINLCVGFKILAVFPYNGKSHHIYFSSLVEELALRQHDVTIVNYFPVKSIPGLEQISIQDDDNGSDIVDMEDHLDSLINVFTNFNNAIETAKAFKHIANVNCAKLMSNKDILDIVAKRIKFDLVIAEQFVTDCGLALAYKLNAPVVGMTAHVLMPWTYSRLGAPNNPAFVPNHFFGTGLKPNFWNKVQSLVINFGMNAYYRNFIQASDQKIVNNVYPDVPDLKDLGKNLSLILLNQYVPLTGSRLYGSNVIEVGGLHIKDDNVAIKDEALQSFIETSTNGVVYISFGTVATNFPRSKIEEILKFSKNTNMKVIWKYDNLTDVDVPQNVLVKKWLPQQSILCHPNVKVFITHSGMLSSSEAMHCGKPIISVPLFGDQYANAASAVEAGLGVTVDITTLDARVLGEALGTVLQERYQRRAKHLSQLWKDRPMTPMDTAVYWIEYVARHNGDINLRPPTVDISFYEYMLLDVLSAGIVVVVLLYLMYKLLSRLIFTVLNNCQRKTNKKKRI